jgi:hypothetical protein
MNVARKITGVVGFIVFIWTFGAIFDGAHDPIFGDGPVRLALIGIASLIPYVGLALLDNRRILNHLQHVRNLIDAGSYDEAERKLRDFGTEISGESFRGTVASLDLLAVICEKRGDCKSAALLLKALAAKDQAFKARLDQIESKLRPNAEQPLPPNPNAAPKP